MMAGMIRKGVLAGAVGIAAAFMHVGDANASGVVEILEYFDIAEAQIKEQGRQALSDIETSALSLHSMQVVREELLIDSLYTTHFSGIRLAWTEESDLIGFGKGW